ncbi:hypothetical protein BG418_12255 [Streptomyces sp. CBMA152]|nr:hypothetical protein [Streptomyces sp. CBMA152]
MPRSVPSARRRALTTASLGTPSRPTLAGNFVASGTGVRRTNSRVGGSYSASVRMAELLLPWPSSFMSAAPIHRPELRSATSCSAAP